MSTSTPPLIPCPTCGSEDTSWNIHHECYWCWNCPEYGFFPEHDDEEDEEDNEDDD